MNDHAAEDETLFLRFLARVSGTRYDDASTMDARRHRSWGLGTVPRSHDTKPGLWLGHASIVLTADTYTSVLPAVGRAAAEGVATLTRQAGTSRRDPPADLGRRHFRTPHPPCRWDRPGPTFGPTQPSRPRKRAFLQVNPGALRGT